MKQQTLAITLFFIQLTIAEVLLRADFNHHTAGIFGQYAEERIDPATQQMRSRSQLKQEFDENC